MNDDWKETYTFTYTNSDGDVTAKSFTTDAADLNRLGEAFLCFLQGSGFNYVTGVGIETEGGTEFGSEC